MAEAQTGIDRRSAIKKAAAAGAIVWTAPTVLSQAAAAQTGTPCTPKCSPATFTTVPLSGYGYCNGNGQKSLFIYPTPGSGGFSCPCGGDVEVFLAVQGAWDRHAGSCTGNVGGSVSAKTCFGSTVGAPFAGEGICLEATGGGAIGNGYRWAITPDESIEDRSGDLVGTQCQYLACVQYNPGSSNCTGQISNVGSADQTGCQEFCSPAP
mgnify:CR=1 FL=1